MSTASFSPKSARAWLIAAGTAVLAISAAPALADTADTDTGAPRSIALRVADLDLGTSQGLSLLDRRLQLAANRACAAHLDAPDRLAGQMAYRDCRDVALNAARQQVAALVARNTLAHR